MQLILPLLILVLLTAALFRNVPVYDAFIRGAKKALPLILNVLPCLCAMLCAISVFRASGALEIFTRLLSPVFGLVGIPDELITLILLRPFSGSAAIALLKDVFDTAGADTYAGYLASVIVGSSETIFYTVAVYFGSVGIKKTRHAIPAAIVSGIVGLIFSVILSLLTYTP